jgi:hypothetical protein
MFFFALLWLLFLLADQKADRRLSTQETPSRRKE